MQCDDELAAVSDKEDPALQACNISILQLSHAQDEPRVFLHTAMSKWSKLPHGEDMGGHEFLDAMEPMSTVYQWVFSKAFASNYMTKLLQGYIDTTRAKWPTGAKTLRQAVQIERDTLTLHGIDRAYWDTCTGCILWIQRTLALFSMLFRDVSTTTHSPAEGARIAVDAIIAPLLSWVLTTLAKYIIGVCAVGSREKLWACLDMPADEVEHQCGVLAGVLQPHVDYLEQMLKEEVPSIVERGI